MEKKQSKLKMERKKNIEKNGAQIQIRKIITNSTTKNPTLRYEKINKKSCGNVKIRM